MPRSVLVVDDNDAVRRVVGQLLTQAGFTAHLARDAEEAVRLHAEHGPSIRVALLDVQMAGADGPETIRRLRQVNPSLPFAFMTGDPTPYTHDELAEMGAEQVFEKPLPLEAVVRVLQRHVSLA